MFLRSLYYCFILLQETKNSSLFDKNCSREKPQENVICDIQHEESWRGWTGKLQVTLLSLTFTEINFALKLSRSIRKKYFSVPNNRPPPPPRLLIFGKFSNPPSQFYSNPPPSPLLLISKVLASHKIKIPKVTDFFVWNSKKVLTSYWVSILNYIHATETIAL